MGHDSDSMATDTGGQPDAETRFVTIRGSAAGEVQGELCDALLSALADGAREIVLDLQGVDVITSSSRALVESVGATLADRGGVLLVLTAGESGDAYLMREVRGDALPDGGGAPGPGTAMARSRAE